LSELASSAVPPAPIEWPAGMTAAACLTFDVDAEAAVLTADISSMDRMSPMSHQSYGPLVGVPRILALLARYDLRATFFVPGYSAHRYPAVVRAIAEAGHEIAHHSYFHENTIGTDARDPAKSFIGSEAALASAGGRVRGGGWRQRCWHGRPGAGC
jgi:peptidoglycan-N-acetylglucosamine deacetylase